MKVLFHREINACAYIHIKFASYVRDISNLRRQNLEVGYQEYQLLATGPERKSLYKIFLQFYTCACFPSVNVLISLIFMFTQTVSPLVIMQQRFGLYESHLPGVSISCSAKGHQEFPHETVIEQMTEWLYFFLQF